MRNNIGGRKDNIPFSLLFFIVIYQIRQKGVFTLSTTFKPARAIESKIPPYDSVTTNGYVWFAVDTGRIYVDTPTERVSVGSSGVSILYGEFPKDIEPNEEGKYEFSIDHLAKESSKPHVNDLVLNSDGTFYKILEILSETTLICTVVSISGGTSDGPVASGKRTSLSINPVANTSLINNQPISVTFVAAAEQDAEGNYTDETVSVIWTLEELVGENLYQQYQTGTINDISNNAETVLDLTDKLRPSTTSRLTLIAHSLNGNINNGNSYSRNVTFTTSELTLTLSTDFSNTKIFDVNNAPIIYSVSGQMSKIVDIYLGEKEATPQRIKSYTLGPGVALNETQNLEVLMASLNKTLKHGYYTVTIKVSQSINGQYGLSIEPLTFEIAVKDSSSILPIIWLGGYKSEYYNYDDIKIPFLVYDPENTDITRVHLYRNGIEMSGSPRDEKGSNHTKFSTFEIVDAELGVRNYYSISCGENERRVERQIDFLVSQDPNRDMSLVKQERLHLLFDAKGRTNNESAVNRETWEYKGIKATFENFNWYNNGWVQDEKGNTCLRISNGAKFILPVGRLMLAGSGVSSQSVAIEAQFKVRNIQDYSPLIHNVTRYKNDLKYYNAFKAQTEYSNYDSFLAHWLPTQSDEEGNPLSYDSLEFDYVQKDINIAKAIATYVPSDTDTKGICIGSQDAFFSNGTNTVNVSFVEDEMVNLTAVYTHATEASNKLLTIFINGILTGVIKSTVEDQFYIGNDNFIFNSEFCDIDLYKMRMYNTNLTINEVITNYAVDTKDVVIFDQNNVKNGFVIDNSAIGELQLQFSGVEKYNIDNPDKYTMPYIVFDTSKNGDDAKKLPWSKKTKVYATVTFVNPALDRAYINGELEELAIKDGLCSAMDNADTRAAAVKRYYTHHCPSWTGNDVEMVVQGTSSEFYPRRNYKLKTKNDQNGDNISIFLNKGPYAADYLKYGSVYPTKEKDNPCHVDFFYMDNYEVGTTKFTMKIDYMESSGSYNTGFANLVANAYSKHPLQDYVSKNRIVKEDGTKYEVSTSYLASLRTSVQGFPVMAFHKRGENDYVYIGRYNMNLDKGSDECYGFKPDKNMYILDANGVPQKARDYAECWEMQNNARGYCSFRDPWNREELSFDGTGLPNCYTSFESPLVADHIEYRYSAYDDALDNLWELNKSTSIQKKMEIFSNLGWAKETEEIKPEWVYGVDYIIDEEGQTYEYKNKEKIAQYDFTADNLEPGRKLFLKLLENWERVTKWVWSTNIDNAISGGEYNKITLGKQLYAPGKFFLLQEDGTYVKESSTSTYDDSLTYYEENEIVNEDESTTIVMVNAWVVNDSSLVYKENTFYVDLDGVKVLDSSEIFDASQEYYVFIELTDAVLNEKIANGTANHTKPLSTTVTFDGIAYRYDTQEYRLAKFRNELSRHFNIEYLATYFIMTEVFECYDSRGKNAMFASWGPQSAGGDYIWYPIFYDIDTQLGINNTGIPSFEYNVDATDDGNYSTSDSILWNNFYKCFKNTYILEKYKQLRGETVSIFSAIKTPILKSVDKIEKWYRCDPEECNSLVMRGTRPLIAINLDEYYKYLTIYNPAGTASKVNASSPLYGLTGRINDSGEYVVETTSYHYALQGDRSLSRRQFLTNRIEYIDSWLNVGNYSRGGYNRLWGRISARRPQEGGRFLNSDRWYEDPNNLATTSYYLDNTTEAEKRYDFDSEYWATLTPIRNSYVTIQDDSAVYPAQKFSGIPLKVEFNALENGIRTAQDYNEQLCYIYGINQMKDLGDLYKMYWQEFKIEGEAGKLTKLLLGCDGLMTKRNADGTYSVVLDSNGDTDYIDATLNPDGTLKAYKWFNNKMNLPSMPSSSTESGMPLLKEANFSNITISTTSPVLDLTSCEKLEDFRATGSNFAQVKFAPGVALNTLYLPDTITTLELNEARLLDNIVEEYHYPVRQPDGTYRMEHDGLYIKGLTDGTATTTYLSTLVIEGDNMGYDSYKLLTKYYNLIQADANKKITMTGVNWCPYTKLVLGDSYDMNNAGAYYRDNGHYGLVPYVWKNLNVFNADVMNGEVYKYNANLQEASEAITSDNMIKDLKNSHIVKLEGTMFINNSTQVDELVVSQLNNKEKYPNLKLFYGGDVKKAYSAKFVLPLELIDEETNTWTYEYVPVDNSNELSIQKVDQNNYVNTRNIFSNPFSLYTPEKSHYDFLGWSTDPQGKTNLLKNVTEWNKFIIEEGQFDNIFYAIFAIKKYPITFHQGENETIISNLDYGTFIAPPSAQPWINDALLELTKTYSFRGYTSIEPGNKNYHIATNDADVQDITSERVTGPRTYYPIFTKMSVYDNIHPEYYNITDVGQISIADNLAVTGKITLPTAINGINVTSIAYKGFSPSSIKLTGNITHIFWAEDNRKINSIGENAFESCENLQYFEMPDSVRVIGGYAFNGCNKLFAGNYGRKDSEEYVVEDFFRNITLIGMLSFVGTAITDLIISNKTVSIGYRAFRSISSPARNHYLSSVQIGTQDGSGSQLDLSQCGTQIFSSNYNEDYSDTSIQSTMCYFADNSIFESFINDYYYDKNSDPAPKNPQNAWAII